MRFLTIFLVTSIAFACSRPDTTAANSTVASSDPKTEKLSAQKKTVERFFRPMKVEDGDWLDSHHEREETFEEYAASNPTLPTTERQTIYIQPIGKFNAAQRNTIRLTAEYMKAFYKLPVKLNPERPLENVPKNLSREIGYPKHTQIRTTYFLDNVLPEILPTDAAALIAFTNFDLYPEDTWHFVFGQASLEKRVGIWSLYRLSTSEKEKPNTLLDRTLKIAMHETGHMFSMRHCTKYECLMSGTNHLAETDRRPLDNCPECMAKLAWAMKYDPVERYNALASFWRKNGRSEEEKRMREMAVAVVLAPK